MTGAMLGVDAVLPYDEGLLATAGSLACSVVAGATTYVTSLWLLSRLTGLGQGPAEARAILLLRTWLGWVSARSHAVSRLILCR
jgi:hypothetical protein